ncbi:MAG: alpha-amylase family protein, partial [Lentisphaeria bacterium]
MKPKYALFFDNHTQVETPDVGKNFQVKAFVAQLKRCGIDYLGFHARCNLGMAYYNTKIGTRHPSLNYDLFGELTEECAKNNIAITAYFNGGISSYEGAMHRDWTTILPDGREYREEKTSPFVRTMCYNSPYRDHLIAMICEVAKNYPVKGFFIDCLGAFGCTCPTCIKMMKEQGIDITNNDAIIEFSRQSVLRLCRDIKAAISKIIPEPMLYFNGPTFESVKDLDAYFDCECLPTAGWGYESLPISAHYMRNVMPGKSLLNMTGRFYDWGDFGGLRNAESLKFDLFYGLAHGLRPNIGGHFHPRGDLDLPVFDRIAEVYDAIRPYDPWYNNAQNITDIAILCANDFPQEMRKLSMVSLTRALEELKMQFDIIPIGCLQSLDNYKLVIIPEDITICDTMVTAIRAFLKEGGKLIANGVNAAKAIGEELHVTYQEEADINPVYFKVTVPELAKNHPDMPLSLYAKCSKVVALPGAETAGYIIKPFANKGWNGTYAVHYTPPMEKTSLPFLITTQNTIYCSGDLWNGFAQHCADHLRDLLKNSIEKLLCNPLVKDVFLPSFSRLILTAQSHRINAHITAYAPEKRLKTTVVEDASAII